MEVSKISQKKKKIKSSLVFFFIIVNTRDGMLSAKVSSSEFQQTSREE
jgi:hypothetical protein